VWAGEGKEVQVRGAVKMHVICHACCWYSTSVHVCMLRLSAVVRSCFHGSAARRLAASAGRSE